jgi:hypothetical protein
MATATPPEETGPFRITGSGKGEEKSPFSFGPPSEFGNIEDDRAATYYKVRKDPSKLQIETLKFMQKKVDRYYAEGVEK